jgi:hypothetical protein
MFNALKREAKSQKLEHQLSMVMAVGCEEGGKPLIQ